LVVEVFLDGVAITADCSLLQTPERGTHELWSPNEYLVEGQFNVCA
jgi:hypothetical protein